MSAAAWRTLLLTLVIALAAGFAGARLGVMGTKAPAGGQDTVRQSVDTMLKRDFQLTADQKQKIQAIDERFAREHNLIWADIDINNGKLASAVATDMSLSPDAKASIQGIEQGIGRLHTASIVYILDVRQVLTPEQRTHFDEHVILALMRTPP